jgi:hypothetical protein
MIVLTFLPLVAGDTPEGSYLSRRLGLQMEDTVFLGMDKLSFFLTVDFEQIPMLKEALISAGIWSLIEYAADNPEMNFTIDQKKTQMVKKFFEYRTSHEVDIPEDDHDHDYDHAQVHTQAQAPVHALDQELHQNHTGDQEHNLEQDQNKKTAPKSGFLSKFLGWWKKKA